MQDLKLLETDALLNELNSRFDHLVFVGLKTLTLDTSELNRILIKRFWDGNSHTCVGLCEDLARRILRDYEDEEFEPPE